MSKTIAACILCKNEEVLIGRALESVKWCNNIYVMDTGSQDRTIEIVKKYTDHIFIDSVWVADFSYHQNLLKSRVKEDFIISLDSDEVLLSTEEEVRAAVSMAKDTVRVTMIPEGDVETTVFGFPRIFRNSPDIYWVSPIHKHLNIPGDGEEVGDVRIMYGYSPAHQRDPDRSLRMLEKTVAEEENPVRNLYYLGREYWYKERYWECIDTFKRYAKVAHWPGELADAYLTMSQAYAALGKEQECADACFQAILINANFKEAIEYMASIVMPWNKKQWMRMARTANNEGLVWKRTKAEPANDIIVCVPHNDDESLYVAMTLIRTKALCLVVTESFIQPERGDIGCTAEIRRQETINAMAIAGCPVVFLGIKDTELNENILRERLKGFNPEQIYVPAIQGGNMQHDLVGKVCLELFGSRCERYCSYTKTELYTTGNWEIKPTDKEIEIKNRMLDCYKSQLELPSTAPHFSAVRGRSEWLF